MAQVVRQALGALHFEAETGEDLYPADGEEGCEKACYDCLLSYYNQWYHSLLDRHLVKDDLMRLADGVAEVEEPHEYQDHYERLRVQTDARSELERRFLDQLFDTRRTMPDLAQVPLQDAFSVPDFFYRDGNVCVFCDGTPHDEPQQRAKDQEMRAQLVDLGYQVVVIRYDRGLEEQIAERSDIFGEARR